jgi:hypothetical protein
VLERERERELKTAVKISSTSLNECGLTWHASVHADQDHGGSKLLGKLCVNS